MEVLYYLVSILSIFKIFFTPGHIRWFLTTGQRCGLLCAWVLSKFPRVPGTSAQCFASHQMPAQWSLWKIQFPKPQLRNNSSSLITQSHWPYNTLLACQKPSTFMWFLNQLDLQLNSRLQIYSQRQQPCHGCKSTFVCVCAYYSIIIVVVLF